ncbi:ATP phosphoribosyltransferase regulatory subunit [candidate division KSB1 bacterium]|nr:ATP phosphoribosyltransferase regulatory subunit [candidate division KSB1 bacterium]
MLLSSHNLENSKLRLPSGVKDLLFEEAQECRKVESRLLQTLMRKGYREIITPTFEYHEVFLQTGEGRNTLEDKTYRFLDRDGNLLALRADFTAQIARIAASRFVNIDLPIRLCYSGRVFRAEPHHAGRSREKWQIGFELLGASDIAADVEAVNNILEGLEALGLHEIRVAIGHIGYFNGLIAEAGCAGETLQQLKYLIARKETAGLRQLLTETQFTPPVQEALLQLPALHGGLEIFPLARRFARSAISHEALAHLEAMLRALQTHLQAGKIFVDLSEVEGMGYYTGIMLRAFVAGAGQEIGSGGRYDDLIARLGAHLPAVGFSFDVDLLVRTLEGLAS